MDKYSLNARIYPMVLFLFPIVIIGISYSIEYEKYTQILTTLGISSALLYFLSNLGRDNGKRKESKLWEKWGGMPSSQLLSFKNNLIDNNTKRKYHQKLLRLSPIQQLEIDFENAEYFEVSEIYKSWTKYLISQTRDTKKYSLLFKENISYGFRRNLWGLRTISLSLLIAVIIGNFIIQGIRNGFESINDFQIPFFISESLLLILLVIWVFIIRSNWVKLPAFAYSERLLESIETINAA
jgi:hypothetical protein